jgi:hypothetical protein
MLLLRPF